ncbi:MAG: heme-copper oxidase subunit III [Mycobacteriales bacterium]
MTSVAADPAVDAAGSRRMAVPGQPDMWAFVLFETLVFTAYFAFYLYNRGRHPELYLQAQSHLHLGWGLLNTITLLTSSWAVARCVSNARHQDWRQAVTSACVTAGCGVLFLLSKVAEWTTQIHAGNTLSSNEFFSYYYFLTAIHLLHLLIGFVVLGVLIVQLRSPLRRSHELIETCATYWHTVDYLWVLIFALLYVVR